MQPHKHPPRLLPWILSIWVVLLQATAKAQFVCPNEEQCTCDAADPSKIKIDCRNRGLTQVPDFEASTTKFYELTLEGNDIPLIPADKFTGLDIERLVITDNPVFLLSAEAFDGLENVLQELLLDADPATDDVPYPHEAIDGLKELRYLQLKGFNMPSITAGSFNQLTKLEELVINSCELSSLTAADLNGPKNSLVKVDLKDNQFSSIPAAGLAVLTRPFTLEIKQNQINSLPDNSFQGVSALTEIDLSQNGLQSGISEQAFSGLENSLISLNLHTCQLHNGDLAAFKILRGLKVLNINDNPISNIELDIFDNMNNLEKLEMQGNFLSSITGGTFGGLQTSLKVLNLAENPLTSVASNTFSGFSALRELYLDGISGPQLNEDSFNSLTGTLQVLSMKEASLTHTPHWPMIQKLTKLVTLRLAKNNLQVIPDMNFRDFSQLQTLDLAENGITEVTQRGTHGLQMSLEDLDLNRNSIASPSVCALDPAKFTALDIFKLRLTGNPLACDCRLIWLHRWLLEHKDDFRFNLVDWKCSDNRLFRNLVESELICDPPVEDPVCENLEPTTTSSTTTPSMTTNGIQEPLLVTVTNTTQTTILVTWDIVHFPELLYFSIEYFIPNSNEDPQKITVNRFERNVVLKDLKPSTTYQICVEMITQSGAADAYGYRTCVAGQTQEGEDPDASSAELQIILGCVFGAVAFFIVVIVIIVCCIRRARNKEDSFDGGELGKFPRHREDVPQAGYNSKRFSRQKPKNWEVHNAMQNIKNKDRELDQKLEGFSPEERDRIINLVMNSGGSTLSMISNASSQRYVPDPPAMRRPNADGYMNPVDLADEQFPYQNTTERHEYEEIPADTYDTIPTDSYI